MKANVQIELFPNEGLEEASIKKAKSTIQYWIGVACKEHVAMGVAQGIGQFCHGKATPARKLKKGDYVIYYSSKISMASSAPYRCFAAIGKVMDEQVYQVEQFKGFFPYRRKIAYFKEAQHIPIVPLIPKLHFIHNKKSWAYVFRFGFLEIDEASFQIIAQHMLGKII